MWVIANPVSTHAGDIAFHRVNVNANNKVHNNNLVASAAYSWRNLVCASNGAGTNNTRIAKYAFGNNEMAPPTPNAIALAGYISIPIPVKKTVPAIINASVWNICRVMGMVGNVVGCRELACFMTGLNNPLPMPFTKSFQL